MAYKPEGKISLLELKRLLYAIEDKLEYYKDLAKKMTTTAYYGEVVIVSDGEDSPATPVRQTPSEDYLKSVKEINDRVDNLTDVKIELEKAIAQVQVTCGYDFGSGATYSG
jgi:hypothetical protein